MFLDTAACDNKLGNKTRVRSRLVSSQTYAQSAEVYICLQGLGLFCVCFVVATSFGCEIMSNVCIYIYSECSG